MDIEIVHKVSHREWDEARLTPDQFSKFYVIYKSMDNLSLWPTFIFDNSSVHADESWMVDNSGRVSTSSYSSGIVEFSESDGQYIRSYYQNQNKLGQLIAVEFTVDDEIIEIFKQLKEQ